VTDTTAPRSLRAKPVRLIGGPMDGETVYSPGGLFIEVPNPDKEAWGDWEFLAYAFDYEGDELVGRFHQND
jgi:hypothetical protein